MLLASTRPVTPPTPIDWRVEALPIVTWAALWVMLPVMLLRVVTLLASTPRSWAWAALTAAVSRSRAKVVRGWSWRVSGRR
jgi:hypothetical protein